MRVNWWPLRAVGDGSGVYPGWQHRHCASQNTPCWPQFVTSMVPARATVGSSSASRSSQARLTCFSSNVGLVIGVQQIRGVRSTQPMSRAGNDPAAVERLKAVPHSISSAYSGCRTSAFRLMSGYGTEQPVCLAVDPVGEVQDIGAALLPPTRSRSSRGRPPSCPPVSIGIVPCNFPLLGIKALISLWRKLSCRPAHHC